MIQYEVSRENISAVDHTGEDGGGGWTVNIDRIIDQSVRRGCDFGDRAVVAMVVCSVSGLGIVV